MKLAAVKLPRRVALGFELCMLHVLRALPTGACANGVAVELGAQMFMGGGACGAKLPRLLLLEIAWGECMVVAGSTLGFRICISGANEPGLSGCSASFG